MPPTAEPTAMPMLNDIELSEAARFIEPGCVCAATSMYSTCDAEFCRYMNDSTESQ